MVSSSRSHERTAEVASPHGKLPLLIDEPGSPAGTLVLAPGAGGGMRSDFMTKAATGIAQDGWRVVRFEFPYSAAGRKAPDRPPVLEGAFGAVVAEVAEIEGPLVIGGKSMGGRIASQVVAGGLSVDGLVFLGYPLHPPGRPERIRDAHLYDLATPMLFVEGTRDPFCPLDTLGRVRERLATSELAVIEDGDHSFKVRKSSGRTTDEAWGEVVERVVAWLRLL